MINRLKGEQGKPNFLILKKNLKRRRVRIILRKKSEKVRKTKERAQNERIKIDRTERYTVNLDELPSDENPILLLNQGVVEAFQQRFWIYYHQLLDYQKLPTAEKAKLLSEIFDTLFSLKTGYQDLDDRIAITLSNKVKLLQVLQFPHIPLHNNPAESGARIQARKRDISLQTKNAKGTKAKDTLMTIVETAKKLGVNTYQYIYDRLSEKYEMISLADLIRQKSSIHCLFPGTSKRIQKLYYLRNFRICNILNNPVIILIFK